MTTEQFIIRKRWSWLSGVEVTIECDPNTLAPIKLGLALKAAFKSGAGLTGTVLRGADLTGADLRGAVLTGADLRGADLTGADLTGADLRGAVLTGADLRGAGLRGADLTGVPKIENIHQTVFAAASAPDAFDMRDWHNACGTSHCRAGWVVTLAGGAGIALEDKIGTPAAAALIYFASDQTLEHVPDFYCDNERALADMKRLAEIEAAK